MYILALFDIREKPEYMHVLANIEIFYAYLFIIYLQACSYCFYDTYFDLLDYELKHVLVFIWYQ